MKRLFFTLMTFISVNALADIPVYYWDNQDKLVEANGKCKIHTIGDQSFRFSRYFGNQKLNYENLRNFNGVKQSYLANESIVKIVNGKKKNKYEMIEVVGVNQSIPKNRWYTERGDQGYLFYRSLIPMEDNLLKLNSSDVSGIENTILKGHKETYWSIASAKSFFKLDCPDMDSDREYIIFRVYADQSLGPDLLVAVSPQETSLFQNPTIVSKYKITEILPNFLDADQSIDFFVNLKINDSTLKDESKDEVVERVYVSNPAEKEALVGTLDDVICLASGKINIRSEKITDVLFTAENGEKVKRFQGWGENTKKAVIDGEEYTFVKIQLSGREETDQNTGWVANRFIKEKSKCPYVNENRIIIDQSIEITGLDDKNCCEFPTVKKPTHLYTSGMRRFKAGRSGGRLHAACDLYRFEHEEMLSVAPGKVIQDVYYFYLGTYALEVKHSGGFVVRYGEIKGKAAAGVKGGAPVKMGQKLGKIGQVNLNVRPMLHFEMYDGSEKGPLTQKNAEKFNRRLDLMDPTNYLLNWEAKSF